MVEIRRHLEQIDWQLAADLYRLAPLGRREPTTLKRAFEQSDAVCFAWDRGNVVGFARATYAGEYQAEIHDVVVAPDAQGVGIGRALMEDMHAQREGVFSITLYAVSDKESFYQRMGYRMLKTGMAILFPASRDPRKRYLAPDRNRW